MRPTPEASSSGDSPPSRSKTPRSANAASPEGRDLGDQLARLCDAELAGKPDRRCGACAFRKGDHVANGSPQTLMSAIKCAFEREPFWCHEHDRPCAGWEAMKAPKGKEIAAPWDHPAGADEVTP